MAAKGGKVLPAAKTAAAKSAEKDEAKTAAVKSAEKDEAKTAAAKSAEKDERRIVRKYRSSRAGLQVSELALLCFVCSPSELASLVLPSTAARPVARRHSPARGRATVLACRLAAVSNPAASVTGGASGSLPETVRGAMPHEHKLPVQKPKC